MKAMQYYILLAVLSLFSATTYAQDVTGNYDLTVEQDPGADDCVWSGNLNLVQSGGNPGMFTGSASVTVVSGGITCAPFSGNVTGTINGMVLTIGVGVGALGTVTFNGNVMGNNVGGAWSGLGVTGTWNGVAAAASNAIPTAPIWALALMAGLLVLIGRKYLR